MFTTHPNTDADDNNAIAAKRFHWDIATIEVHLDQIRSFWASRIGVSVPQWMVLAVLDDLDTGSGVTVKAVSAKMFVTASFITTQSKLLEAKGFITRRASPRDPRIIVMYLTPKARTGLSTLILNRAAVQNFLFSDFDGDALKGFMERVAAVRAKCERATRLVAEKKVAQSAGARLSLKN